VIDGFPDLDLTGMLVSCTIALRLRRLATDAADTYGADAEVWDMDIHVQNNSQGSRQEFVK
jgi:hypothetical protein